MRRIGGFAGLVLFLGCGGDDVGSTNGDGSDSSEGGDSGNVTTSSTADSGGNEADEGTTDGGPTASGTTGTGGGESEETGGSGSCSLADILDETTYESMFLHRDDPACEGGVYSYQGLLDAAAVHPKFACEGTTERRTREVAAFLAQIGHETTGGWPTAPDGPHAWGLCFVEEVGCADGG